MFSAYAVLNPGPNDLSPLKASWLQPPSVITPVSSSTTLVCLGWAQLVEAMAAMARKARRETWLIQGSAGGPAETAAPGTDKPRRPHNRRAEVPRSAPTSSCREKETPLGPNQRESRRCVGPNHARG